MRTAILAHVTANPGQTCSQICEATGCSPFHIWNARRAGEIFSGGPRKHFVYASTQEQADALHYRLMAESAERRRNKHKATPKAVAARKATVKKYKAKQKASKPKPVPLVFAKPKATKAGQRGPAHIDGPATKAPGFRHVVYPSKPDPTRSNTFSQF